MFTFIIMIIYASMLKVYGVKIRENEVKVKPFPKKFVVEIEIRRRELTKGLGNNLLC